MMAAPPRPLTGRQAQILGLITTGLLRDGYQPSYRGMMAEAGIAWPNGIRCHLRALAAKGYIGGSGGSRAIPILAWPDGRPFGGIRAAVDSHDIVDPSGLTETQAAVLGFAFSGLEARGYQPSIREAQDRFKFTSKNGVCCHLRGLSGKGFIGPAGGQSRAIRFLRTPSGERILGYVPVGEGGSPWES